MNKKKQLTEADELINEIRTELKEDAKEIAPAPTPTTQPMKQPSAELVKNVPDEAFEIYALVKSGYSPAEIRIMYPDWSAKKFKAIQNRVNEIMAKNVVELDHAKAEAITRYNDLYSQAYKMGNIKECKNILDSLAKVQGLNKEINIQADFTTIWR